MLNSKIPDGQKYNLYTGKTKNWKTKIILKQLSYLNPLEKTWS